MLNSYASKFHSLANLNCLKGFWLKFSCSNEFSKPGHSAYKYNSYLTKKTDVICYRQRRCVSSSIFSFSRYHFSCSPTRGNATLCNMLCSLRVFTFIAIESCKLLLQQQSEIFQHVLAKFMTFQGINCQQRALIQDSEINTMYNVPMSGSV